MRDRLIELLKLPSNCMPHAKCESCGLNGGCSVQRQADKILADGWMRPHCKVGDKVYVVYKGGEYYWQAEVLVVWIRLDKDETDTTVTVKFKDGTIDTLHSEEIYITKEQAEQALRKEEEGK